MPEDAELGQIPNWRAVLRASSPETRNTARMWLYYTLFYWLVPTFIAVIGLIVSRQPIQPVNLIIHGEFLIYAITLTASSTRLISKDVHKSGPFVNRQAFNLWAQIMIFPAIFVYGLLRYIGSTSSSNILNAPFIVTYSIILLIGAFYFSYVVFTIDVQRSASWDVQRRAVQAIEHSPDKLDHDFDALQAEAVNLAESRSEAKLDEEFDSLGDDK